MTPPHVSNGRTTAVSDPLFKNVFEGSPDAILVINSSGTIVRVNTRTEKMFGYNREELIGRGAGILVGERYPDERLALRRAYANLLDSSEVSDTLEAHVRRKDGTEFPVEILLSRVPGAVDGPLLMGVVRDITDRKEAAEALRRREEQLQSILDNSPAVIFIKDRQGRYLEVNRSFELLSGISRNQALGRRDCDLFPKEEADRLRASDQKVFNLGCTGVSLDRCCSLEFEDVILQSDGPHTYLCIKFPLFDGTGTAYAVCGIATDITGRKRTEEMLREREAQLQSILDYSPADIYLKDLDGRYLRVNRSIQELNGLSEEQMIGKRVHDLVPKELADRIRAREQKAVESRSAVHFEHFRPHTNEQRTVAAVAFPILDASGTPRAVCGITTDITERKQAEEALRDREQQLQSILDNSPTNIYVKDRDGRYLKINRHCQEALGAGGRQVVGKTVHDLLPKEEADALRANDCRVFETGCAMQFEETVPQNDGNHTYLSTKFPLFDSQGAPYAVCGISADITERQRAEATVRESEARFRQLADFIPQIVWTVRPDGSTDYYNQRWIEFTGCSEGQTPETWESLIHPDDLRRCMDSFFEAVRTGKPYHTEYRLKDRGRGGYRWFMGRAVPIKDNRGEIVRWLGTSTDIDDVKRAEREREDLLIREQQARQEAEAANRAKDQFLAVISHELRTPLTPILMWTQILKSDGDPIQIPIAMEVIERNVRSQLRLIDDLLDLNRAARNKMKLEFAEQDLALILWSAVANIQSEAEQKRLNLTLGAVGNSLQIRADAGRLQQVFTNLLVNAVKFTPEGGSIRVTFADEDNHAVVRIRDTGEGIAPGFLPHVFEMFRQQEEGTRRSHAGLGIGLALVKSLVEFHGGQVEVKSDGIGCGTEVIVRLPLLRPPAATGAGKAPASEKETSPALKGVSVLLVEDSEDSRKSTELLLKRLGARMASASDGREALNAIAANCPDLILCDLAMPRMDGFEFIKELQRLRGSMHPPVIALSGLTTDADHERTRAAGFAAHVDKPFDEQSLLSAVVSAQWARGETG